MTAVKDVGYEVEYTVLIQTWILGTCGQVDTRDCSKSVTYCTADQSVKVFTRTGARELYFAYESWSGAFNLVLNRRPRGSQQFVSGKTTWKARRELVRPYKIWACLEISLLKAQTENIPVFDGVGPGSDGWG